MIKNEDEWQNGFFQNPIQTFNDCFSEWYDNDNDNMSFMTENQVK